MEPKRLTTHLEIPAREIAGDVTSLAYGEDEKTIYVGTTAGTMEWNTSGYLQATGKNLGLAVHGSTLFAANSLGLAQANLPEAGQLSSYNGRPAKALLPGPGGPLELGQDGTVSLIDDGESGINAKTFSSEDSLVASFGPEGALLETTGPNASHVEELVTVRPGTPEATGKKVEPLKDRAQIST